MDDRAGKLNDERSSIVDNAFTGELGIETPIICGAMYPCSNPELVAAASQAGAIGIVQPMSLNYVHGHDVRVGLRYIRSLTSRPIGMNLIIEKSSSIYEDRIRKWFEIALEEDVRFFITALGNPRWVVDIAKRSGATVYHDVTNRQWAEKALDAGVDGFICVNRNAGGHAGTLDMRAVYDDIAPLGKPLICAGGISSAQQLREALDVGYLGVQLGTRFIATSECNAHADYKQAIVQAKADDIVLTERISGVPVAVIKTPYIERLGTKAGPIARWLLKGRKTKHWMRLFYTLQSVWQLKRASQQGANYKDYWQAGRSVEHVNAVLSAQQVVDELMLGLNGRG